MEKLKKNKKALIIGGILLFLILCLVIYMVFFKKKAMEEASKIPTDNKSNTLEAEYYVGNFSKTPIKDEKSAKEALNDVKTNINLKNPAQELDLKNETTLGNTTYYRFKQVYEGIEVLGKEIIVESTNNEGSNLIYNTLDLNDFSTEYKHSSEDLIKILKDKLQIELEVLDQKKVIYSSDKPVLAYQIEFLYNDYVYNFIVTDEEEVISVDAVINDVDVPLTGGLYNEKRKLGIYTSENKIVFDVTGILGFKSTFGYVHGKKISLVDSTTPSEKEKKALDNVATTYDYYANNFNHKSFDGYGNREIRLFLDIDNKDEVNYNENASYFSSGDYEGIIIGKCSKCEAYELKVLAHEYTHAVFNYIVGSYTSIESSSINEAYADILGLIIDADSKNLKEPSWTIYGRDFKNPQEGYRTNYNQVLDTDPHKNATILGNVFYKMYDGDGNAFNKMDLDTLAELFYRSMYLIPYQGGFKEATSAIILTSEQMENEDKITPDQLKMIKKLFQEAGFNVEKLPTTRGLSENIQFYHGTIFAQENFKLCAYYQSGELLEDYHLKIELINSKEGVNNTTIMDEDVKNCVDTKTPVINLDSDNEQYYQVSVFKNDVLYNTIVVTQTKEEEKRENVSVFTSEVKRKTGEGVYLDDHIEAGRYKLYYGKYHSTNMASEGVDVMITINKDGTCRYQGFESESLGYRDVAGTYYITKITYYGQTAYSVNFTFEDGIKESLLMNIHDSLENQWLGFDYEGK